MALLPMGPPTTTHRDDRSGYYAGETQETMFDEPTTFAAPETDEAPYQSAFEAASETSYEPAEEFAEDVPELISYQSGSGHAGIATASEPVSEPAAQPETPAVETAQTAPATDAEPPTILTANDFAALEERVLRAVALVRTERQARIAAEERVAAMEAQLHSFEAQIQQIEAQSPILDRLVQEVESLRIEREQVRQRVERLLGQLDALEL